MEVTRDLQSLNLLAKLMVLYRQILFCLAVAAIAEAILMQTSAEQVTCCAGHSCSLGLMSGSLDAHRPCYFQLPLHICCVSGI